MATLGSAVTILCEGDQVVLVDAGLRSTPRRVAAFLEMQGLSLSQVTHILVSHWHPDHIAGLAAAREASGALVAVHPLDTPAVCGANGYPSPFSHRLLEGITAPLSGLLRPRPVPVDLALEEGFRLDILGGLEVIHTPGHTPGSVCFYFPALGLLHVSDSLQCWGGRVGPPSPFFTQDMAQARASIRRMAALHFDVLSFSHFPPVRSGAREALQALADRLN